MQVSVAILVGVNRVKSYIEKFINFFKIRVASYPNSVFEAGACLIATLTKLKSIGLLNNASLIITPNAYNTRVLYDVVPNTPLGDMTVIRPTTATRVNSLGLIKIVGSNIPRIDYTNGSCPSLLVEPQRTNLALYSEQFDNAYWTKLATGGSIALTANYTNSPSGVLNADRLLVNNASNAYVATSTITVTNATSYTMSIYAKSNTGSSYTYQLRDGYSGAISSNLTITPNWQRFTLTFTSVGVISEIQFMTTVVGASDISIWGTQLEQGSYPTSYIPTVASTVTRANDIIFKTGISSLIGQTEGTVFVDVEDLIKDTFLFSFNESTTSSVSILKNSSNEIQCQVWGSTLITILSGSVLNERLKIAFAYKSGNIAVYINGIQIGTSSTTFTFGTTMDTLYLPYRNTYYAVSETAKYNLVQLYKTRLTNTELAQLTTL